MSRKAKRKTQNLQRTKQAKKRRVVKVQTKKQAQKLPANNVSAARKATASLSAQVISPHGKTTRISLPEKIFKVEVAPQTLAQAVRVYLANQRKGTASTKTRGKVRGGGAKPWRQKGTGRARQGSIRAPHWRHGGVVFGPQPRDFSLKIPAKVKQKALFGAISEKFAAGEITIVDNFEKIKPKTKELNRILTKLGLPQRKVLWIVNGESKNLTLAGRNLPNLSFCKVSNLTTYQVLAYPFLIFSKEAIDKLRKLVD